MNILVLSKKEAVKLSYKEFDRSVYAISIHSNYEYPARLHLQQSHVLSLCFDDIDGEYPTAISKEDANKIAGFVLNRIPGDARLLIVHCEAGQSRSAGVAAAIHKMLGWEILNAKNSDVFADKKFHPNNRCYYAVLEALQKKKKAG